MDLKKQHVDFKEQQKRIFCDNISELEENIEKLKTFAIQNGQNRDYVEELALKAKKNTKILSLFNDI